MIHKNYTIPSLSIIVFLLQQNLSSLAPQSHSPQLQQTLKQEGPVTPQTTPPPSRKHQTPAYLSVRSLPPEQFDKPSETPMMGIPHLETPVADQWNKNVTKQFKEIKNGQEKDLKPEVRSNFIGQEKFYSKQRAQQFFNGRYRALRGDITHKEAHALGCVKRKPKPLRDKKLFLEDELHNRAKKLLKEKKEESERVHPDLRGKTVVVVGGGPVGLYQAIQLTLLGFRVHILESRTSEPSRKQIFRFTTDSQGESTMGKLFGREIWNILKEEGFVSEAVQGPEDPEIFSSIGSYFETIPIDVQENILRRMLQALQGIVNNPEDPNPTLQMHAGQTLDDIEGDTVFTRDLSKLDHQEASNILSQPKASYNPQGSGIGAIPEVVMVVGASGAQGQGAMKLLEHKFNTGNEGDDSPEKEVSYLQKTTEHPAIAISIPNVLNSHVPGNPSNHSLTSNPELAHSELFKRAAEELSSEYTVDTLVAKHRAQQPPSPGHRGHRAHDKNPTGKWSQVHNDAVQPMIAEHPPSSSLLRGLMRLSSDEFSQLYRVPTKIIDYVLTLPEDKTTATSNQTIKLLRAREGIHTDHGDSKDDFKDLTLLNDANVGGWLFRQQSFALRLRPRLMHHYERLVPLNTPVGENLQMFYQNTAPMIEPTPILGLDADYPNINLISNFLSARVLLTEQSEKATLNQEFHKYLTKSNRQRTQWSIANMLQANSTTINLLAIKNITTFIAQLEQAASLEQIEQQLRTITVHAHEIAQKMWSIIQLERYISQRILQGTFTHEALEEVHSIYNSNPDDPVFKHIFNRHLCLQHLWDTCEIEAIVYPSFSDQTLKLIKEVQKRLKTPPQTTVGTSELNLQHLFKYSKVDIGQSSHRAATLLKVSEQTKERTLKILREDYGWDKERLPIVRLFNTNDVIYFGIEGVPNLNTEEHINYTKFVMKLYLSQETIDLLFKLPIPQRNNLARDDHATIHFDVFNASIKASNTHAVKVGEVSVFLVGDASVNADFLTGSGVLTGFESVDFLCSRLGLGDSLEEYHRKHQHFQERCTEHLVTKAKKIRLLDRKNDTQLESRTKKYPGRIEKEPNSEELFDQMVPLTHQQRLELLRTIEQEQALENLEITEDAQREYNMLLKYHESNEKRGFINKFSKRAHKRLRDAYIEKQTELTSHFENISRLCLKAINVFLTQHYIQESALGSPIIEEYKHNYREMKVTYDTYHKTDPARVLKVWGELNLLSRYQDVRREHPHIKPRTLATPSPGPFQQSLGTRGLYTPANILNSV